MTDQNRETAQETAQGAQDTEAKDPFEGFESESFNAGEPIEEKAAPATPPKKEAAPPPPKKEAELPAGDEVADDVVDDDEGEESGAPEPKEGEQPPKKKSVQERINEVTRARREAERRAEAAEAKTRELEERLRTPPKEEPKEKKVAPAVDPNEPDPEAFDYGEIDPRYIKALASYEADKRFAELRAEDAKERQEYVQSEKQQAARQQFETMIEVGSKKYEDFYEKVVIGSEAGDWPLSQEMGELLLASDVGNEVAYHLATNPEEADKIFRSSPVEQARYFGRLEAKFSAEQTAAAGDAGKSAPKTPKAPAPIRGARGAGGYSQATADTDDFAAFEQRANQR